MSPKLTSDVPPDGRRNDTKDWWRSLQLYATNIFSQSGEDGVLARIFECIGATSYFCVEFGARDGQWLSNTKIFRDAGWSSLLMDCNAGPGVQKVFITAENVNFWFKRHGVPREIDLLSIDIDGNDLWIWKALKWKARVVVIEHNPRWPVSESKTIAYNPDHVFDNTQYHGASLAALAKVGREKGMEMVWHGNINAIFVQRDLLPEDFNRPLLHKPMSGFPADPLERPWEDY